jgi:hypothetical protein
VRVHQEGISAAIVSSAPINNNNNNNNNDNNDNNDNNNNNDDDNDNDNNDDCFHYDNDARLWHAWQSFYHYDWHGGARATAVTIYIVPPWP